MARKKKVEVIETLGKNEEQLVVQKSMPLFELWRSSLTLSEFKILDVYLSRINSHNPDKRMVVFGKNELEGLLGVKRIDAQILDDRLKHLMETSVNLCPGNKKRVERITLFEHAIAEKDECGQWEIRMMCTNAAMKYVFNIEKLGYLRYKVRCIVNLKSRYSYIMFLYIEHNRFRKTWEVGIDELKERLGCTEETYKENKRFVDLVLKKVNAELSKTECRYTCELIKFQKKIVSVRFTVQTISDLVMQEQEPEALPGQITAQDYLASIEQSKTTEQLKPWMMVLIRDGKPEFDLTELAMLDAVLRAVPASKIAKHDPTDADNGQKLYMAYMYGRMNVADKAKTIKNRLYYLAAMLLNDVEVPKDTKTEVKNRFKNFHEREYTEEDYGQIERMLMGL